MYPSIHPSIYPFILLYLNMSVGLSISVSVAVQSSETLMLVFSGLLVPVCRLSVELAGQRLGPPGAELTQNITNT
jgi:hypothetical protein